VGVSFVPATAATDRFEIVTPHSACHVDRERVRLPKSFEILVSIAYQCVYVNLKRTNLNFILQHFVFVLLETFDAA